MTSSTDSIKESIIFYQKLIQDSPSQIGRYPFENDGFKEVLFADLVSLFFEVYPDKNFELTTLDLQMITSPLLGNFKRVLKQIKSHTKNGDQLKAREGFTQYISILKACLTVILNIQQQVSEHLKEAEPLNAEKVDFDFKVAQNEWDLVQVPHHIEIDLGKSWPLMPQLHAYVSQVYHLLSPKSADQLKHLYHQLATIRQQLDGVDKKEHYRINVLCSTLKWIFQEKIHLNLIKACSVSPLAALFTRHES